MSLLSVSLDAPLLALVEESGDNVRRAGVLLRDHRRGRDDASVVAMRAAL